STRTPALVLRCVLRDEEGRCFFQELPVHAQLDILGPQPLQLGPLVGIDRAWRVIHLGPLGRHPPTEQLLTHANLARDLGDRPAGVNHQMSSITTVRRGITLPLGTHEGILSCQAHLASQDVHQTGSTSVACGIPWWWGGGLEGWFA